MWPNQQSKSYSEEVTTVTLGLVTKSNHCGPFPNNGKLIMGHAIRNLLEMVAVYHPPGEGFHSFGARRRSPEGAGRPNLSVVVPRTCTVWSGALSGHLWPGFIGKLIFIKSLPYLYPIFQNLGLQILKIGDTNPFLGFFNKSWFLIIIKKSLIF